MVRVVAVIMIYLLFAWSCAHVKPIYDENGNLIAAESSGFLRNVKIYTKKPDGSELMIESSSTTGSLIGSINEVLGTVTGAAKGAL